MRRSAAALGSTAFFVAAPGSAIVLIPWLISHWRPAGSLPSYARGLGGVLIVLGIVPVVAAFVEFVRAGGTPAPIAPTRTLVVSGFNRHLRNPMYVGVVTAVLGQALLFGSLGVLAYAGLLCACFAAFVRWYEEPTLTRTYGGEYEDYRRAVPAWWPRLRPWSPELSPPVR